jgi:phosphatidate cytidylyltransferase
LAGPLALLPAWLTLLFVHASPRMGPQLALLALALVWAADVGAYATGRMIGRIKLAPTVSPGKTWEGVGGGVLLALAVAWAASVWLDQALLPLLAVAAATALVSVIGDLTLSMLKRNVGLKDTGSLLPGHGGVMDRIDGLVAAVPAYAAGLRLAGLVG